MPRYYFHLRDSSLSDPIRVELPDRQSAWDEAVRTTGEMLKDLDGDLSADWTVEVCDEAGKCLFRIRVSAEQLAE
jgi:hypothetical protein